MTMKNLYAAALLLLVTTPSPLSAFTVQSGAKIGRSRTIVSVASLKDDPSSTLPREEISSPEVISTLDDLELPSAASEKIINMIEKDDSYSTSPKVISTLDNRRGSDGMGLPSEMSQKTVEVIEATTPAVAPRVLDITKHFYQKVLAKHPGLLAYFNPAHNVPVSDHQPKALAASVAAYATNIANLAPLLVKGGAIDSINHRHCALSIFPDQYTVVYENLMESIGDILGSIVSPEIGAAWGEAVLFLAKAFIGREEDLYKMAEQRRGGWSGLIDFEVSEIKDVAENIKRVSFRPPAGSDLEGSEFEFTAGQYLTIKVDPEGDGLTAPRHYTVTSPINADYLQCAVKKVEGGKVSNFIHDQLKVGDIVKLAAPYGVFTADSNEVESAVLISAGIGVTPMVNLKRELGEKVKLSVHVDSTPQAFAFQDYFQGGQVLEKFTKIPGGKRPESITLAAEIIEKAGKNHNFYICGPEEWMNSLQKELLNLGAKNVMCEVFGSQMATGCPFSAMFSKKP